MELQAEAVKFKSMISDLEGKLKLQAQKSIEDDETIEMLTERLHKLARQIESIRANQNEDNEQAREQIAQLE